MASLAIDDYEIQFGWATRDTDYGFTVQKKSNYKQKHRERFAPVANIASHLW
jgi:hypothetical protein